MIFFVAIRGSVSVCDNYKITCKVVQMVQQHVSYVFISEHVGHATIFS